MTTAKQKTSPKSSTAASTDSSERQFERIVGLREKAFAAIESFPITSAKDAIDILAITMLLERSLGKSSETYTDRLIADILDSFSDRASRRE
jgi:hypothetical protein